MKAVLEILKRYVFEIVCGAVAAAGIGLAVLGLGTMAEVIKEMEGVERLKSGIETMSRSPNQINEEAIAKAQRRIDTIESGYDEVMEVARAMNAHEPLTDDVFPTPRSPLAGVEFQRAYRAEMAQWLAQLHARGVPTADDVAQERDRMEAEKPADTSLGADADPAGKAAEDEPADPYNTAEVRAAIRMARDAYLYATPESFQDSPVSAPGGPMYVTKPPTAEEMWHAQLEVWIQRDLVEAIAAINDAEAERLNAAAAQASERETKLRLRPWVGNLPIKELVSFQMSTYYIKGEGTVGASSTSSRGGRSNAGDARPQPPSASSAVFTGNTSNEQYELLRFTVKLVVDARDIPAVVAGLSRNGFHVPLNVSYESIPPDLSMTEKVYGDEPLASLVIDFETVLFSEFYLAMMPDKILEELAKERPQPETEGA